MLILITHLDSGENFFDKFDYFTGYDPAGGLVQCVLFSVLYNINPYRADIDSYVDAEGSAALNLTYATKSSAILQVDTTDKNATTGRRSARITSKTTYNHGLFIFSILRTPFGCAIWPALWLTDPSNWPAHGEIDIIEATNNGTEGNAVTLHTTAGCTMEGVKRKGSKYPVGLNCAGGSGSDFDGCSTGNGDYSAYGPSLNSGGGGVYAMEWRTAGIRVCFWPMSDLAPDIEAVVKSNGTTTTKPDPSTWSTPQADFPNTKCDIDAHFSNQSIIANIDFCGEAQAVFKEPGQCAGTCEQAVATGNFSNAVWEWGGWWVYQSA